MKNDEKIIAEKMIGLEPLLKKDISSKIDGDLIACLNWYSYMSDEKDTNKWIVDYMKKNNYSKEHINHVLSSSYNSAKKTTSALCRMWSNGSSFSGEMANVLNDKIHSLLQINIIDKPEVKTNDNVISIQDRIRAIAQKHMMILEEMIDSWYFDKTTKIEFSLYNYVQKEQLNAYVCNQILAMIKRSYLNEFEEMLEGNDECLNEGYAYLSKQRKKQIHQGLTNLTEDLERYIGNVKTSKPRKPKKKKPISVTKQINSLKYQKEFNSLKIKSIDPQMIVGAHQLWVFNTKLNQLTMFNSLGPAGFSIKGTTIQNYDPDSSIKKKIRKPNEIIPKVLDGGKIVLKKLMSDLTTKPVEVNGRINDDTVLLRAIR